MDDQGWTLQYCGYGRWVVWCMWCVVGKVMEQLHMMLWATDSRPCHVMSETPAVTTQVVVSLSKTRPDTRCLDLTGLLSRTDVGAGSAFQQQHVAWGGQSGERKLRGQLGTAARHILGTADTTDYCLSLCREVVRSYGMTAWRLNATVSGSRLLRSPPPPPPLPPASPCRRSPQIPCRR